MPTSTTTSLCRQMHPSYILVPSEWKLNVSITPDQPNITCAVSTIFQIIEENFNSREPKLVKGVNKLLLYERENPVQLVFEHLDSDSLHIVGFLDGSFEKMSIIVRNLILSSFSETASTEPIPSISSLTEPGESSITSFPEN